MPVWWMRGGLGAALALGAVCRLAQYAAATSLWHDEAFVALIVRTVPFTALLGPLDWNEPAPPGFLALEKVVVAMLGESEWSLRAVPLLASLAGLLMVARLAQRGCLAPGGALFAVLLAAASPTLIADAAQVKHFSLDLLIAALLVDRALVAVQAAPPRAAPLLGWGAVAAVGLWFSYAAAFVIAGSGIVLAATLARHHRRRLMVAAIVAAVAIGLSAALLAPAVLAQRSAAVVEFWSAQFAPYDNGLLAASAWLGRGLVAMFDHLWRPLGGLLIIPSGLAALAWWRSDRRPLVLLLWLPVGAALLASIIGWWPFGGTQHMAFAAPAMLLLAGDGMEILRVRLQRTRPLATRVGLALFLIPGLLLASWRIVVPRQRHAMREAIAFMQARAEPEDRLAVFDPATFQFYTGRDVRHVKPELIATARIWIITPTSSHGGLNPEVESLKIALAATRPALAAQVRDGAAAYLFGAVAPPRAAGAAAQ